ncbi:OmpA family protein [Cupriavidus plantarum]|uniref:Outer membrane protein OmpA-like peptidoglycan-associated protein n=2 Tax=Cupriavidus plantarum TaxID=942865 RepID=A0A316EWQ4_9BURK|nr:OmpA family protein [Cupriavidus plantarum]PWK37147.1 outer membrane protein OmpA-like peptidoglycan-associated protein [Cupriavidus plantarum]
MTRTKASKSRHPSSRTLSLPRRTLAGSVAACLLVSGCATAPGTPGGYLKDTFASDDPCANNARNIGLAAGVVVGALLGAAVSNNKKVGALVGAGVGAAAGGLIGADMDRRRCELARIAQKHGLDMTVTPLDAATGSAQDGKAANNPNAQNAGLLVAVTDNAAPGKAQFAHGSAELQPAARASFMDIALQYSYVAQSRTLNAQSSQQDRNAIEALKFKRILLVGHTDDTGASTYNADLSERRARAVAAVFREAGVPESQLFYQGAGETLPVADNHLEAGRAKNRRVEIVDLTDDASLARFLEVRRPNVAFYRNTTESPAVASSNTPPRVAQPNNAPATAATTAAATAAVKPQKSPQPPRPAAPATAAVRQSPDAQPSAAAVKGWDFGGAPTRASAGTLDLGKLERSSGFSIIPSAVADTPITRCDLDRPRASNAVKSLKDDKAIATGDYMPGLFNTSWVDKVNGNLVALNNVAVLRDGGAPARKPTLLVYRDYRDSKQEPELRTTPEVNTYRGDKALLYRVFVNQASVQCLDIVIPHKTPDRAEGSWLRYDKMGEQYSAAFNPQLVRVH